MNWRTACLLGLMAILPDSPLDTWLATFGYCRPNGLDPFTGNLQAHCVPAHTIYFQCIYWAAGMLMGAPISMAPAGGPYGRYFSETHPTPLSEGEQAVVLTLKSMTAIEWITVIARFVQVYNNLDPDTRDFRVGWDALNSFVTYFKVRQPHPAADTPTLLLTSTPSCCHAHHDTPTHATH